MSYYRRGYNWENIQYLPAPVGGWNPDANTWELPENQAPMLDNVLIRPGKIVSRGAVAAISDLSAYAPLDLCGAVANDAGLRLTRKETDPTAYVDHWNVPLVKPTAYGQLANAKTNQLFVPPNGGPPTAISGAPLGPRWINFGGYIYGITYDASQIGHSVANDVLNTYTIFQTQVYTLPPTAGSGVAPTYLTSAPRGAFDIKGYQSRIWLLGGCDVPGADSSTHRPITLYFTIPMLPGGGSPATDWQDPVNPAHPTNKITLTDGDASDYGVALAIVRNGLLILRRYSIEILRGSTQQNYVIQTVSRETGCVDARSVVETDRGTFFLSQKGLMVTDGAQLRNVSGSVTYTIQAAVAAYLNAVTSGFGGYASCMLLSDGQILVSIGQAATSAGVPTGSIQPLWCGLFNPTANTWVRVTSVIWQDDGTMVTPGNYYPGALLNAGPIRKYAIGDKYLSEIELPGNTGSMNDVRTMQHGDVFSDANVDESLTNVWIGSADPTIKTDVAVQGGSGVIHPVIHFSTNGGVHFALPSDAVINGIQVDVNRDVTSDLAGLVTDYTMQLQKASVPSGSDLAGGAQWPVDATTFSFGGSGSLWGTTWTAADINNPGFGVKMAVALDTNALPAWSPSSRINLHDLRITVYYTSAGGPVQARSMVRTPALYDRKIDGNYVAIPVVWKTRLAPTVGTTSLMRKLGQAKRWFVDYVFGGDGLPAQGGWYVVPVDADDNQYGSYHQVRSGNPPTVSTTQASVSGATVLPHPQVQRDSQDFFNEISDIGFGVIWFDNAVHTSAPTNVAAELYGIGIEYQPTRDLR